MDLSTFRLPERRKKADVRSATQLLAHEIAADFGESRKVGFYLAIVKRLGVEEARRIWREVRSDGARNPAALFTWKTKRRCGT